MDKQLQTARHLAKLLDSQFKVGPIKFGLDPILGLLPGGGDLISLVIALYIVLIGIQLKLPTFQIIRMLINVGLDTLIGAIPIIGDIFDIGYKGNIRNLQIIEKYKKN